LKEQILRGLPRICFSFPKTPGIADGCPRWRLTMVPSDENGLASCLWPGLLARDQPRNKTRRGQPPVQSSHQSALVSIMRYRRFDYWEEGKSGATFGRNAVVAAEFSIRKTPRTMKHPSGMQQERVASLGFLPAPAPIPVGFIGADCLWTTLHLLLRAYQPGFPFINWTKRPAASPPRGAGFNALRFSFCARADADRLGISSCILSHILTENCSNLPNVGARGRAHFHDGSRSLFGGLRIWTQIA